MDVFQSQSVGPAPMSATVSSVPPNIYAELDMEHSDARTSHLGSFECQDCQAAYALRAGCLSSSRRSSATEGGIGSPARVCSIHAWTHVPTLRAASDSTSWLLPALASLTAQSTRFFGHVALMMVVTDGTRFPST